MLTSLSNSLIIKKHNEYIGIFIRQYTTPAHVVNITYNTGKHSTIFSKGLDNLRKYLHHMCLQSSWNNFSNSKNFKEVKDLHEPWFNETWAQEKTNNLLYTDMMKHEQQWYNYEH